jgi:hypothetical protein
MTPACRALVAIATAGALAALTATASCVHSPEIGVRHPTAYRACTWQLQRDEIVRASIDRPGSSWRPALAVDASDRPFLAHASGEVLTSEQGAWRAIGQLPPAQDFAIAAGSDELWVLAREGAIATTLPSAVSIHHRRGGAWEAPVVVKGIARFGRTLTVDGHGTAHAVVGDDGFDRLSIASSPDWEPTLVLREPGLGDPFAIASGASEDDVGVAFVSSAPPARGRWSLRFVRPEEPSETVRSFDDRLSERTTVAMAGSSPVIATERKGDVLAFVRANDAWTERVLAHDAPFPALEAACPSPDEAAPCTGTSTTHELGDVASGGSAAIAVIVERHVTFARGFVNGSGPGPYPPVLATKSRAGTALLVGAVGASELGCVALPRPLGDGEVAIATGPRGLVHVAVYEQIVPEDQTTYHPARSAVRYLTLACVP